MQARADAPLRQAVFVPVARDDSPLHPELRRGGGFTIGEKGSEKQFSDFNEALEELQRMPVPYWRRPNESGNWGIVDGIRWERLDKSDLDRDRRAGWRGRPLRATACVVLGRSGALNADQGNISASHEGPGFLINRAKSALDAFDPRSEAL
jgi:hypothetical protein